MHTPFWRASLFPSPAVSYASSGARLAPFACHITNGLGVTVACQKATAKRKVKEFRGIAADDDKQRTRMRAAADRLRAQDLKDVAELLCLPKGGKKEELVDRVCTFLHEPSVGWGASAYDGQGRAERRSKG